MFATAGLVRYAIGDADQSRTLSIMNCARCKDAGIVRQVEYLNVENGSVCTCEEGRRKWEEIERAMCDSAPVKILRRSA